MDCATEYTNSANEIENSMWQFVQSLLDRLKHSVGDSRLGKDIGGTISTYKMKTKQTRRTDQEAEDHD